MKKIVILLFICQVQIAEAQQTLLEITRHYRVMDSLTKKKKLTAVIEYAQQIAPVFKENNSFPFYHYFKLQVEYIAWAYNETGQHSEAAQILLQVIPEMESAPDGAKLFYKDAVLMLSFTYLSMRQLAKAYQYSVLAWKNSPTWSQFAPSTYVKLCISLITLGFTLGKYDEAIYYAEAFEATIVSTRYTKADLTTYYLTLFGLASQMGAQQKMALYMQKTDSLLSKSPMDAGLRIQIKSIKAGLLMMAGRVDSASQVMEGVMKDLEKYKLKNTEAHHIALNSIVQLSFYQKNMIEADSLLTYFFANRGSAKNAFTWTLYFAMGLIKYAAADYQAALLYTDTALSMQPPIDRNDQQVEIPIIAINKSLILLKLNRVEEAIIVYEKSINDYISYIKKNISYVSEPDKNNMMLINYLGATNYAPGFILTAKKEALPAVIRACWEQALFFRGVAMGEQSRAYKALRKKTDTALLNLVNQCKELRLYLGYEYKKHPLLRAKNINNLALLLEKKEQQLRQYLPKEIVNDTLSMITKLYQSLRPGEAIIDFKKFRDMSNVSANSNSYGAYILRYDNPNPLFQQICSEEAFSRTHRNVNTGLLYPPEALRNRPGVMGNTLYKLLWQPLSNSLKNIKTVYIVPDGLLHKVAFHALPVGKKGYLSGNLEIRYLFHASSICNENFRKTDTPSRVQVWAGINYDTTDKRQGPVVNNLPKNEFTKLSVSSEDAWPALPNALKEAQQIEALCKMNHIPCRLYTGAGATESAYKKNIQDSSDLLSIITHGKFDTAYFKNTPSLNTYINMPFTISRNPMQQVGFVMAGRNQLIKTGVNHYAEDDRILRADEVAQLNLENKKLVVLSACKSGLGPVAGAEGVYGMARAFKMAGADKVLISLWNVPDSLSKLIMAEFYKFLLKGESAHIALKKAQQYMRKINQPFSWAGYVLIE